MGPIGTPLVNLSRKFLDGQGASQLAITAPSLQAIMAALQTPGGTLPPGDFELGSIQATAQGSGVVRFGPGDKGKVTFSGQAGGGFGVGVYADGAEALRILAPGKEIEKGFQLADSAAVRYAVVQASYSIGATAQGSIALGTAGSVTFGGSGSSNGIFAVIHRFQDDEQAVTVFGDTFRSWVLPRLVDSADDLAPGTWVLAEIDGSFALNAGIRAGYDFSWIQKGPLGLTGDIGLRVQLGASATLGFEASGKYAVVVSREDADPVLRVRIFKLAQNGWKFALSATAGVKGSVPDGNAEDFISAIFGLNKSQLVDGLREARAWVDPKTSLADKLSGVLVDLGQKELNDFTGTDIQKVYEAGRAQVQKLLASYDTLGHEVTSLLLAMAGKDRDGLKQKLDSLVTLVDLDTLKARLFAELKLPGFERTPLAQLIEAAVANKGLLSSIQDETLAVQSILRTVHGILDGRALQDVLDFIGQKVGLEQIRNLASMADFNSADAWLKDRVAKFLGKTPGFDDLQKLQAAVAKLMGQSDQFFKAAVAAARKQYNFSWNLKYSQSTTATALIDAEFDFREAGVPALFAAAVSGDFGDLLVTASPGVTLNAAELTHNVKRQISSELTLPFGSLTSSSAVDSKSTLTVTEDDGRILMYSLNATSTSDQKAALFNARSARNSTATITANLPVKAGVKTWKQGTFSYNYTLRRAVQKMRVSQFQSEIGPLVRKYLPSAFSGPDTQSFEDWVTGLDKALDQIDPNSGTNNLGDSRVVLEVILPPKAVQAWTLAPKDEHAPVYGKLSVKLQEELKQLVMFYFFSDPARYAGLKEVAPVLIYAAMPATTNIRVSDDGSSVTLNVTDKNYWDFRDMRKVTSMVNLKTTGDNLRAIMTSIGAILRGIPELASGASDYDPTPVNVARIRRDALTRVSATAPIPELLGSLLQLEAELITNAIKAGQLMGKFVEEAGGDDPADALDELSSFGAKITSTFNSGFGGKNPFLGDAARPLGNLLFVAGARAFDPSLEATSDFTAMMNLTIVKSTSGITVDNLLNGKFEETDVLKQFPLVQGA